MFVYFVNRRLYCGERYTFPLGLIPSCAVCVFSLVAVSCFLEFSPGVLLTVFYRFSDGCLPVFYWSFHMLVRARGNAWTVPSSPTATPFSWTTPNASWKPSSLGRWRLLTRTVVWRACDSVNFRRCHKEMGGVSWLELGVRVACGVYTADSLATWPGSIAPISAVCVASFIINAVF